MILVTGGTGLVGAHLLYKLTDGDEPIRAIYRKDHKLEKVKNVFRYYDNDTATRFKKIEWILCELSDITILEKAFEGVTQVYHCAAFISFDPSHYKALMKSNQEGTANVVNQCIHHGINKLCYVSSIATIGTPIKKLQATEETEFNTTNVNVYALSKHAAESEVWRGSQEGLNVVVVNPGVILGPGFWYRGSGVFISRNAKKRNFYLNGGTGFVSVSDVVKAMVLLMQSNIINERFILVSENLSFRDVQKTIAECFGHQPPKRELKKWMLEIVWRLDWLRSKLTSSSRILTKNSVSTLSQRTNYSNEKIKTALTFEFEPIDKVIAYCCHLFLKEQV